MDLNYMYDEDVWALQYLLIGVNRYKNLALFCIFLHTSCIQVILYPCPTSWESQMVKEQRGPH